MIDVQNDHEYPVDGDSLVGAAALVLQQHDQPGAITIVIANNDTVRGLNRQFRGVDAPTDVLSFPTDGDSGMTAPGESDGSAAPYLGDLVIAFPYAQAQAQREGHDLGDSLRLLVVHGTLHLLGYDHDSQEGRTVMWAAQARALTALNIPLDIVPALENAPHDPDPDDGTDDDGTLG